MGVIAVGGLGVGCVTQTSMIAMQASVSKDDLGMTYDVLLYCVLVDNHHHMKLLHQAKGLIWLI